MKKEETTGTMGAAKGKGASPAGGNLSSTYGAPKLAYTMNQAVEAIGLSRSKIYQLIGDGSLRSVVRGGRRLFTHDALNEFLQA